LIRREEVKAPTIVLLPLNVTKCIDVYTESCCLVEEKQNIPCR